MKQIYTAMQSVKNTIQNVPAVISSLMWGTLGIYLVVLEVINIFKNVRDYPDLILMDMLGIILGLSWAASAFLQWHKKKVIRIITNIYLLIVSAGLIPLHMVSAAAGHRAMTLSEKFFPFIGIILSIMCIVCAAIKKR